jgi:hypothetical protein
MSTQKANDRSERRTNAPETRQIAAELGVDARLLADFVDAHPNPTAPAVMGWGQSHGSLRAAPADLRDDVAAWLDSRPATGGLEVSEEELEDTEIRTLARRAILGGEDE